MVEQSLQEVARLARKGNIAHAYELAQQITVQQPDNFHAWMWLAYVAQMDTEKRAALRRAHVLRPHDAAVREALRRLIAPRHIQRAARSGVFMGYARADELFAVDLTDSLRSNGIYAWMDMTEISFDTTWHSSVARALTQSGLMLLVLSPEAVESGELQTERRWFMEAGKIIVPVLHKTCDYASLGLLCPAVDFRQDYATGLKQLLELLKSPQRAGQSA
jgi:hypothetical protein